MRRAILLFTITFLLSGMAYGQADEPKSEGSRIIDNFKFGELELNIPEIGVDVDRIEMDNGLIVFLYEDPKIPLFNLHSVIRCGSIFESNEHNGLSGIVGTVMRTGGTINISGDSLNRVFEYIGGSLETGIGTESGTASLNVLSKNIALGIELFADLMRNPAFPDDKIELAKADIKNSIKRRNDRPASITSRYYDNIVYGEHPYGRILEWESVKNITQNELLAYHKKYFVPNNTMIAVAGDFDTDEVLALLTKYLGDWKKSDKPLPEYPEVEVTYHPGVYQIYKDINQANIRMGHLGIKRDNPDRYAINLMNYILGAGSFTSRLTATVRSDEGLAYSVGSRFDTGNRDYGTFYAYCQTKSSTAYKAIKLMLDEIQRIREEGITETELSDARDATINKFIFTFDNPAEIVNNLMYLEYNGYPSDHYKHYLDYYRKLTIEDINRVAMEYLKPDKISLVVVGNPETYEKPLDDFGQITNIEPAEPVLD